MLDQYGNAVPADLFVLPSYSILTEEERQAIFQADWYEVDGILLASEGAMEMWGDDPQDVGLKVDEDGNIIGEVFKIDNALKRGNPENGFYHV